MNSNLPEDYSYIEWKQPGKRWLIYQIGKTTKLPLSIFYGEIKNVTSLQFVSKDPNINLSVLGDSLIISATKLGEFTFKGVVKKNNVVVSISPEYKINLATEVEEVAGLPTKFDLYQNYPNPISLSKNDETIIKYSIPKTNSLNDSKQVQSFSSGEIVTLKIYDILGREISTVVNEMQNPGVYNYKLSINQLGLTSGIYFYQLKSGSYISTKKFVVIK